MDVCVGEPVKKKWKNMAIKDAFDSTMYFNHEKKHILK